MTQVGLYAVDSTALGKPPAERQYELKGLYDLEEHQWSASTDPRIFHVLPDDQGHTYTIEDIQEAVESPTLHVYFEDDVPGRVSRPTDTESNWQTSTE